jgi:hypothetical protein
LYDEHEHSAEGRIQVSSSGQPADATVLTPDGIRTISNVEAGSLIWSGKQWTKITRKAATGVKTVAWYHTVAGSFLGTAAHHVIAHGKRVEVRHARVINTSVGDWREDDRLTATPTELPHAFFAGVVLGSNDDEDLDVEIVRLARSLWIHTRSIRRVLTRGEEKTVPDEFFFGPRDAAQTFLCGLCSANGRLLDDVVLLSLSSRGALSRVQQLLSLVGVDSHYIAERNIPRATKADPIGSGYQIFINCSAYSPFIEKIGFFQQCKTKQLRASVDKKAADTRESVARLLETCCEELTSTQVAEILAKSGEQRRAPSYAYAILDVQPVGEASVFDLTVEAEEHTYWTGGLLVSSCS